MTRPDAPGLTTPARLASELHAIAGQWAKLMLRLRATAVHLGPDPLRELHDKLWQGAALTTDLAAQVRVGALPILYRDDRTDDPLPLFSGVHSNGHACNCGQDAACDSFPAAEAMDLGTGPSPPGRPGIEPAPGDGAGAPAGAVADLDGDSPGAAPGVVNGDGDAWPSMPRRRTRRAKGQGS